MTMEGHTIMKKNSFKKVISLIMAVTILGLFAACSSSKSSIDDTAATRGPGEGAGQTFIDDEAIALADGAASTQDIAAAEAIAFNLVNKQRESAGLPALAWNTGLYSTAKVRAKEIVSSFSHTRPDGSEWWTVNSNIMYGENLAKHYQSGDSVVTAWMNSPTHKANILDGSFKSVGIAIFQTETGAWFWAQEFGY